MVLLIVLHLDSDAIGDNALCFFGPWDAVGIKASVLRGVFFDFLL